MTLARKCRSEVVESLQPFQKSYSKNLIKRYPIINHIFKNFDIYDNQDLSGNTNFIFKGCIPRYKRIPLSEKFVWVIDELHPNRLEYLEITLLQLDFFHWTISEKRRFTDRLTSPKFVHWESAYEELLTTFLIGITIGFSNLNFQLPVSTKKVPDISFILNDREVVLELTALGFRDSEKKIQEIFDHVVNHILTKITLDKFYILIYFDTSKLLKDDDNNFDVTASIEYLILEWDKLKLGDLAGCKGRIDFEYGCRSFKSNEFVFDATQEEYGAFNVTPDLYKMIQSQAKASKWAKMTRINEFNSSPFASVSYINEHDDGCVEIQSREFDSNDPNIQNRPILNASLNVKKAFRNQILRSIRRKKEDKQYKGGVPLIVAIKAREWRYRFEEDYESFVPLRDIIMEELNNFEEISGIIIYSSNLYNGRYIENSKANNNVKVTEGELRSSKIIRSYDNPQLTADKEKDITKVAKSQQKDLIEDMLNQEASLVLRNDKIKLLESLESYLDEEVNSALVKRIGEVITKYCNDPDPIGSQIGVSDDVELVPISYPTLRGVAASCIMKLARINPTEENVSLCIKLSDDVNTIVRECIANNLGYLCDANYSLSFKIAKKYVNDNWRVRFYLVPYLKYIFSTHRENALELCQIIIEKYGKSENVRKGNENLLLQFATSCLVFNALKEQSNLDLEELMTNSYNYEVKRQIARETADIEILQDKNLTDRLVYIYTSLGHDSNLRIRHDSIGIILRGLIRNGISLFPKIKPFLELAANQKYQIDKFYFLNFSIIEYLDKFWQISPQTFAYHLIKIFKNNPSSELYLPYSDHLVNVIKNLLSSSNVNEGSKQKLKDVTESLRKSNNHFEYLFKDLV